MQQRWWFCPRQYSSTYGLTLMCLGYVVNLSGAAIWQVPTHMVLKMHITKYSELKLQWNNLSGGGDAYSVAWGKSQLGTLRCGWFESQRLTAWLGQNSPFYRVGNSILRMHAVTKMWPPTGVVHRIATVGNKCLKGTCRTHQDGGTHCISLLYRYGGPTEYKKVKSCDTLP